jgi:hypothetical protein
MASPASPSFARGYPSKDVAIAAGAPGILSNIADLEPPYTPPVKTPVISARALNMSHENVNEINRETAIVTDNPGIAPT